MAETNASSPPGPEPTYDLNLIRQGLFDLAKKRWCWAIVSKFLAALLGALALFVDIPIGVVALAILLLTVLSEMCGYFSDAAKSQAQRLHDKLDFQDSLSMEIKSYERRDIIVKVPSHIAAKAKSDKPLDPYFAATDEDVIKRALKNLEESSWWTEHLAGTTRTYLCWMSVVLVLLCLFYLLAMLFFPYSAANPASQAKALTTEARLGVALLSLLPSLGVIKLITGYHSLSLSAGEITKKALAMQSKAKTTREEVGKLWLEYHAKRAAAPMVPGWVYRFNQKRLNELWNQHKA